MPAPAPARTIQILLHAQGGLAIAGGLLLGFAGLIVTPGPEAVEWARWLIIVISLTGFAVGASAIYLAIKWPTRRKWIWRSTVAFETVSVAPTVTVALLENDGTAMGGISVPIIVLTLLMMPSTRRWFSHSERIQDHRDRQFPEIRHRTGELEEREAGTA
ncbi:hypothetical protein [Nonomuraea sp. SBT364]|uniref:hypothetical protein n=1 Tax=Nonomuraea sp. SBT364 TaxID=1580530 RepID=UPI0012E2495F|nr:hypothetical protein [Nonomuraea sp. SBT364]